MNERIRLLAEQAGYKPIGTFADELMEIYNKKFAELIVKECADIAYKTSWDALVHGYGQAVIPLHLYNTIKKHFGVSE